MLSSAFDLGEQLNNRTLPYIIYEPLWQKYALPGMDISFSNWTTIKYMNASGDDFSDAVNSVPNNAGGLYLFYVKCPVIVGITEFPFYIGRAQHTEGQNLRKRIKEYYSKFSRDDERPKITKMFKYWSRDLHLAYLVLDENETVIDCEKNLINSLLLPMNDEIPEKEIRQAVKAF